MIYRILLAIALITIYPAATNASEKLTSSIKANTIDTSESSIVLSSQETMKTVKACKPIVEARTTNIGQISIGSTVQINDISFEVGIIKATQYNKDHSTFGVEIAKKDEIICMVAEDRSKLPYESDCDAIWLRIRDCKVID